jgi:hypothetical protein
VQLVLQLASHLREFTHPEAPRSGSSAGTDPLVVPLLACSMENKRKQASCPLIRIRSGSTRGPWAPSRRGVGRTPGGDVRLSSSRPMAPSSQNVTR